VLVTDPVAFARWHLGELRWSEALRSGAIKVQGIRTLARTLPTWHQILNEARNHSTASTLRSPPEGVSGRRNLNSRKTVSTELVGGSDLDPPVRPVDALPPFQVRGEVFHVRLPASAVGSELT
jgi:hypothetical protein